MTAGRVQNHVAIFAAAPPGGRATRPHAASRAALSAREEPRCSYSAGLRNGVGFLAIFVSTLRPEASSARELLRTMEHIGRDVLLRDLCDPGVGTKYLGYGRPDQPGMVGSLRRRLHSAL